MPIDNDQEILDEIENIGEGNIEKPSKMKKVKVAGNKELEQNKWIADVVDETISDGYIYSGAERQTQQAEAWRRYFREPYGNELDGYSKYVSPMIQTQVNQVRAFITEQYFRNSAPIIKFRPDSVEDAEEAMIATEYVNDIFRNKLNGHKIIDDTVFNMSLLKFAPVRVYCKEVRSKEPIEFKHESANDEECKDKLAKFIVANNLQEVEPELSIEEVKDKDKKDITYYYHYKWPTDTIIEKYPDVEVISPENFFISRQAESVESAKVVAKITNMMLSEVKQMFPDAPALNGFKKGEEQAFWEQLQSDYQTWYSETTWFAKWTHDSLQFFEQYDNQNDESAGLGTKELFVVDAEIYLDQEDTGDAKLCHVIKAGNNLLYIKEISERSFEVINGIPTANRWLGIGLWDLLEQEAREETTLTRAFTDSAVQAAHPNIAFDPGVYESDDIYNRGPDATFRVKIGATPQLNVKPLEVIQLPGPDSSVQGAIQHFKAQASEATGVGAGFSGANKDDISDMRIDKETAKAVQNNSTLMLNSIARNYANGLCKVLIKILDVGIKSGATPRLLEIQEAWQEVDPMSMKPRSSFVLNADIGVNDAQEKLQKAQAIMQAVSLLQGQPDPETGKALGVTAEILPSAGYELGKAILEANGAKDSVGKIFVLPETMENPQVQAAIQNATQELQSQFQSQLANLTQQITEQVKQDADVQKVERDYELKKQELELKRQEIDNSSGEKAFKAADSAVKEERYDEQQATEKAIKLKELELKEKEIDNKFKVEMEKINLDKEGVNKSTDHQSQTIT